MPAADIIRSEFQFIRWKHVLPKSIGNKEKSRNVEAVNFIALL